ncbi:DUF2243 domain-containing protein [Glutamicibacter protophormiae]|uniref:DUF2243 domain-containing protein n=1 Tax=Glutamicibacter protophormiae TaxID=37930 RepID=UPI003BAF1580
MDLPVTARSRNLYAGVFLGLGSIAFLDEVVFHQLLHWHHFYDKSSGSMGLVSDGLFHAFSWFATVAGLLIVVGLVRDAKFAKLTFAAGMLTGAGFFQLYDGLVQHKLLGLHQIRYGVPLLPYDVVWNVVATVMLAAGITLWATTGRMQRRRES